MSVDFYRASMPTLLRVGPYQFYMVMFDCRERIHVHVKGGGTGHLKLWLEPEISVAAIRGYTARETAAIMAIGRENRQTLVRGWIEECGRQR
jgi:hypothetical protein